VVTFQIKAVYQLRPELFRVRVLVASRGYFSGRSPCHSGLPKFRFQKFLLTKWSVGFVLTQNVNVGGGGGGCGAQP